MMILVKKILGTCNAVWQFFICAISDFSDKRENVEEPSDVEQYNEEDIR